MILFFANFQTTKELLFRILSVLYIRAYIINTSMIRLHDLKYN